MGKGREEREEKGKEGGKGPSPPEKKNYGAATDGSTVGTVALLASTCVFGGLDCFYRASAY